MVTVSSQRFDCNAFATRAFSLAPLDVMRNGTNLASSGSSESFCSYSLSLDIISAATFTTSQLNFSRKIENAVVYICSIISGLFSRGIGLVHVSQLNPGYGFERRRVRKRKYVASRERSRSSAICIHNLLPARCLPKGALWQHGILVPRYCRRPAGSLSRGWHLA